MDYSLKNQKEKKPLRMVSKSAWERMNESDRLDFELRMEEEIRPGGNFTWENQNHRNILMSFYNDLRTHFEDTNRMGFVGVMVGILYPNEKAVCPDMMIAMDSEGEGYFFWNVIDEGRGPDMVLEVTSEKTKTTDTFYKLNYYSRLEIPEYFVFDPDALQLVGYRLDGSTYRKIEAGRYSEVYSKSLSLSLKIDGKKLGLLH